MRGCVIHISSTSIRTTCWRCSCAPLPYLASMSCGLHSQSSVCSVGTASTVIDAWGVLHCDELKAREFSHVLFREYKERTKTLLFFVVIKCQVIFRICLCTMLDAQLLKTHEHVGPKSKEERGFSSICSLKHNFFMYLFVCLFNPGFVISCVRFFLMIRCCWTLDSKFSSLVCVYCR